MRIWPIILDTQPPSGAGVQSRAQALRFPLGTATVLEHLRDRIQTLTPLKPLVITDPVCPAGHTAWIGEAWPGAGTVSTSSELAEFVASCELSDVLLIIDPRFLPRDEAALASLVREAASDARVAHHLVAFERSITGTKERVSFDATGHIRRIVRHYERATWPFIAGVAATALPISSGVLADGHIPASLTDLRQALTAGGVPGRDIPARDGAYDLSDEPGLLAAMEHFVRAAIDAGIDDGARTAAVCVGGGQFLDETVRITGAVVIHAGARIGAQAMICGPAVIGPDAVIAEGAVVAHSAVGPGCSVPPGFVLQNRAWLNPDDVTPAPNPPLPTYSERLLRLNAENCGDVEDHTLDEGLRVRRTTMAVKRCIESTIAGLSLVALSPVLAMVAVILWFESKGPIFYGDTREGLNGRVFRCWKFRTMRTGAHAVQSTLKSLDKMDGPHFKIDRDPRVTRVGRVLRATNLDELPQLFNVLVGDMSLIGPRPSPFRENQVCVPWRDARLSVRPGITGMWQVCRKDRSAGDFHQWIEYDLAYVRHLSLWLDLKILVATIATLGGKTWPVPSEWLIPQDGGHVEVAATRRAERPQATVPSVVAARGGRLL